MNKRIQSKSSFYDAWSDIIHAIKSSQYADLKALLISEGFMRSNYSVSDSGWVQLRCPIHSTPYNKGRNNETNASLNTKSGTLYCHVGCGCFQPTEVYAYLLRFNYNHLQSNVELIKAIATRLVIDISVEVQTNRKGEMVLSKQELEDLKKQREHGRRVAQEESNLETQKTRASRLEAINIVLKDGLSYHYDSDIYERFPFGFVHSQYFLKKILPLGADCVYIKGKSIIHPDLSKKPVSGVLIPYYAFDGYTLSEIVSYQLITDDGEKKYLAPFSGLGENLIATQFIGERKLYESPKVMIAESYADGMTAHIATSYPCFVIGKNGLKRLASLINKANNSWEIILIAQNESKGELEAKARNPNNKSNIDICKEIIGSQNNTVMIAPPDDKKDFSDFYLDYTSQHNDGKVISRKGAIRAVKNLIDRDAVQAVSFSTPTMTLEGNEGEDEIAVKIDTWQIKINDLQNSLLQLMQSSPETHKNDRLIATVKDLTNACYKTIDEYLKEANSSSSRFYYSGNKNPFANYDKAQELMKLPQLPVSCEGKEPLNILAPYGIDGNEIAPTGALPIDAANYVKDMRINGDISEEVSLPVVLGAMSIATESIAVVVMPFDGGTTSPTALYTMVIGGSGAKKSSAFRKIGTLFMKAWHDMVENFWKDHKISFANATEELENEIKSLTLMRKECKDKIRSIRYKPADEVKKIIGSTPKELAISDLEQSIISLDKDLHEMKGKASKAIKAMLLSKTFCNSQDTTIEGFYTYFQYYPCLWTVYDDEWTGKFMQLDSKERDRYINFYNSMWDGKPPNSARVLKTESEKNSDAIEDGRSLTLCLGAHPAYLLELMRDTKYNKPAFKSTGLNARFLFSYIKNSSTKFKKGKKKDGYYGDYFSDNEIDIAENPAEDFSHPFLQGLYKTFTKQRKLKEGTYNDVEFVRLKFTREAWEHLESFYNNWANQDYVGSSFQAASSFIQKLATNTARIAAIFHLFNHRGYVDNELRIDLETTKNACKIAEYFLKQQLLIMALTSGATPIMDASIIARCFLVSNDADQRFVNGLPLKELQTRLAKLSPYSGADELLRNKSRFESAINHLYAIRFLLKGQGQYGSYAVNPLAQTRHVDIAWDMTEAVGDLDIK